MPVHPLFRRPLTRPLTRRMVLGGAAASLLPFASWAQPAPAFKPTRPVKLISPLLAGGATDAVIRPIAQRLAEGGHHLPHGKPSPLLAGAARLVTGRFAQEGDEALAPGEHRVAVDAPVQGGHALAAARGHLLGSRSTMRVIANATTKISSVSTTATADASPTRPLANAFW